VTITSLTPAEEELKVGKVQEIEVSLLMVKDVQGESPTVTVVTEEKLVPVIVITLPDTSVRPLVGETEVMAGGVGT
jgi:hypothetical protein